MIAAAAITPTSLPGAPDRAKPLGMNGSKLAASKNGSATMMNIVSATILITTSPALRLALSRVPAISSPATTAMIAIAGKLTIPPSSGPLASANGMSTSGAA